MLRRFENSTLVTSENRCIQRHYPFYLFIYLLRFSGSGPVGEEDVGAVKIAFLRIGFWAFDSIGDMEMDHNIDTSDKAAAPARGGFRCCFPFSSSSWKRIDTPAAGADGRSRWGRVRAVAMKVQEWSELVAGPRWKTFLRRFWRNPKRGRAPPPGTTRFGYDAWSYSLNFDEGHGDDDNDQEGTQGIGDRGFSARLATYSPALSKFPAGGPDASASSPFVVGGH